MRIAIISTMTGWAWGGSEELWFEMAMAARRAGHQVGLMLCRPYTAEGPLGKLSGAGAELLDRPRLMGGGRWQGVKKKVLDRFSDPFGSVVDWHPDVICVSQGGTHDLGWHPQLRPLADSIRRAGKPYAVVCQMNEDGEVPTPEMTEGQLPLLRGAATLAFVSERNRQSARRQFAEAFPNAVVVRNPVNLPDLSPVPWPADDGVAGLASVARLSARIKGHDVLLEALADAAWPADQWRLNLYGQGEDRDYLRRLAAYYGIGSNVVFQGQVSDVRGIWANNHMAVMPSRVEGTPLALVESMSCGRPAVVSNVGGNVEWVSEPENGFIAEAATPGSFGGALRRAWAARDRWPAMGVAAAAAASKLRDPSPGTTLLDYVTAAATMSTGRGS